jgi:hypothetical protein
LLCGHIISIIAGGGVKQRIIAAVIPPGVGEICAEQNGALGVGMTENISILGSIIMEHMGESNTW